MPNKDDHLTRRLFRDPSGQMAMFDKSYEEELEERASRPVECLGMTFPNDEARRAYFTERLREHLQDPAFRAIEGFPLGADEDILALSDAPYYTACPNPFLGDFIRLYGKPYDPATDGYRREPFAADVSEGKNHPIYNAHSYHTKVPHKAIMRYILHYTEPGDIVYDGFCGTGMTGVAAALCGDLGSDRAVEVSGGTAGARRAILSDLSPMATFIASNLMRPIDRCEFLDAADSVISRVQGELGYLYETAHTGWKVRERKTVDHVAYPRSSAGRGRIEFALVSDVVRCPVCSAETTVYSVAVDEQSDSLRSELRCPACTAVVAESDWEPVYTTYYDSVIGESIRQVRLEPVLINYSVGSTRYEKLPDGDDRQADAIALSLLASHSLPAVRLIDGKETQRNAPIGVTHLHQFYTPREHLFVAALLDEILSLPAVHLRQALLFALTACLPNASRMRRFRADRKGGGPLSGTLYISSLATPPNVLRAFSRSSQTIADSLSPAVDPERVHVIGTQDAGSLEQLPDSCVDYIFTDPPFGYNFDYSELNFFWEGLLGVVTNQETESIISSSQGKGLREYGQLMENGFMEYYRILKPGRWMTVEFSNTKASVWNAIQSALERSGFVVANVASLDKQQHSFKAVTTTTAVKQDLVISAYKPNGGLEERFRLEAGSEEGAWDFTRTHLRQLPAFVAKEGRAEVIAERQSYLLYDRMVAFHVQRGITVPLSASEFYAGLAQRYPERDGMFFLPDQAAEYDRKRLTVREMLQLQYIVTDESSAIQWLRQQLTERPQTFQDLHPQFLREIGGWSRNEKPLELSTLLEQSFLRYDGLGAVPSQVHSYLSSNFHELRNLPKDDAALRAKGKDRWYVPDPHKAGDLEKLRERALLREFDEYVASTQRRLRVFRLEAVRAGFKRAWQARDYATIIAVAEKIPESVLQEDAKLLMWYDQAVTRSGGTA